jgi:hypothetical protein
MKFNAYGLLDPGEYPLTFSLLRESVLVRGEDGLLPWDENWRRFLVDSLERCVLQLWECGVEEIYIDGSFVTDKFRPNDIDGYFIPPNPEEVFNGELERRLNRLDPHRSWGWNRYRLDEFGNFQLELWHHYRVDLFPHCRGVYAGIAGEDGENMTLDQFFRRDRDFGVEKGIVKLIKG